MVGEDIYTIWQIFGPGGLIDKLGPDRAIRELKKRCDAGAIIGCSLYKLLIEKWIDVATGAKDPGQRGPAEDFMQSAGEDELVKKIEDLHVQYPNGIPRSIRMDVKDDWNHELEMKVGRRIPLDPKDASKKDIAESKKIAEQLAAGVGLPRPLKPKVGIEELPLPPPVKPVERAPPRAAPPEVVPTPIITRAVHEYELMKKEIEEQIQEEKRRRLKRGPIAGESSDEYLMKGTGNKTSMYSGWTYDDFKLIINRTTDIEDLMELAKHIDDSGVMTPGDKMSVRQLVEKRKRDIVSGTPEIKRQKEEWEIQLKLVAASRLRDGDDIKKDMTTVRIKAETYDRLTILGSLRETFEDVLKRLLDCYERIPEIKEWLEYVDRREGAKGNILRESDSSDYKTQKTVRISVNTHSRISKLGTLADTFNDVIVKMLDACEDVLKGKKKQIEAVLVRERDDVMQVPGDITQWEFGDFEGQIPGLDDPEDLEILLEYTDVSDKLAKDEAKTIREMIKERIRKVEKAGS